MGSTGSGTSALAAAGSYPTAGRSAPGADASSPAGKRLKTCRSSRWLAMVEKALQDALKMITDTATGMRAELQGGRY